MDLGEPDTASSSAHGTLSSSIIPLLAEEIRASGNAILSTEILQKRAEYINRALDALSPELETRFEFFIRSHFTTRNVKRILQAEVDQMHKDNVRASDALSTLYQQPQHSVSLEEQQYYHHKGFGHSNYYHSAAYRAGRLDRETGAPMITDDMTIVVCGLAKLFVGELVDIAREIMINRVKFEDKHRLRTLSYDALFSANTVKRNEIDEANIKRAAQPASSSSASDVSRESGHSSLSIAAASDNDDDDYTSYQIMPSDIEEAANRMYDDGKTGRSASIGSHLLSGGYNASCIAANALSSTQSFLYSVTNVAHPTAISSYIPHHSDSARTCSVATTSASVSAPKDGEGVAQVLLAHPAEQEVSSSGDVLMALLSASCEDSDVTHDTSSAESTVISDSYVFSNDEMQTLADRAHQQRVNIVSAIQLKQHYRYQKWLHAKQEQERLKREEEERIAAAAAARAAQEAQLLEQKQKIAALVAQQQAKAAAVQQANIEAAIQAQTLAAATTAAPANTSAESGGPPKRRRIG